MPVLSTPVDHNPWARGYSYVVIQQNEGMIRGRASINTDTAIVDFVLGLETDRVDSGPIGKEIVTLHDAGGKVVATIDVGPCQIGGKTPGHHVEKYFNGQATVPHDIASKVTSIAIAGMYVGQHVAPWEAWTKHLSDIITAAEIVVTII